MHDSNSETSLKQFVAKQLAQRGTEVADRWLSQLKDVVDAESRDIFPTDTYLNHIPQLIEEVARVLGGSMDELALSNSLIRRKAMQLGHIRHQQRATVNQLLREYDLLSKILEQIVIEESDNFKGEQTHADGILLMASVSRIVRAILQATVDSFVEKYMNTIDKQTEKLLAFNAFVSHELKTPLQAASLDLELLLEDLDITDDSVTDLTRIQASTQQAISMLLNVESLIRRSDIESLASPIRQEVELSAMLRDIEKQLAEALDNREVEISIEPDLGTLYTETAKLELVFTNLLTNAVKYSDSAKRYRRVDVKRVAVDDPHMLRIDIEDNGLGIKSEMLQEVLKMRVRAHENLDTENEISGHGLGLYLVSEAMKDIGGEMSLDSEHGQGTVVHLSFPVSQGKLET